MCSELIFFLYVFLLSFDYILELNLSELESEPAERAGALRSNDATAMRMSLESEFAFFQSLSQLFLPSHFVK